MHTSAVDAGAGTPWLQDTRCPSRVHPYMLHVASVYTVSIRCPSPHAAQAWKRLWPPGVGLAPRSLDMCSLRAPSPPFPRERVLQNAQFPELAQQSPQKKVQ